MCKDLRKLDRLDEQTRFLGEHKIETLDEVDAYQNEAEGNIEKLKAERDQLRNRLHI